VKVQGILPESSGPSSARSMPPFGALAGGASRLGSNRRILIFLSIREPANGSLRSPFAAEHPGVLSTGGGPRIVFVRVRAQKGPQRDVPAARENGSSSYMESGFICEPRARKGCSIQQRTLSQQDVIPARQSHAAAFARRACRVARCWAVLYAVNAQPARARQSETGLPPCMTARSACLSAGK
jgi:hypothetical protein